MSFLIVLPFESPGKPAVAQGVMQRTALLTTCIRSGRKEEGAGSLRILLGSRCFEGALAACAAPLVGKLAERMFGFSGAATRSGDVNKDLERARALGSSLLVFLIVPWTLCLIFYSGAGSQHPCQQGDSFRCTVEELWHIFVNVNRVARERVRLPPIVPMIDAY